MNMQPAIIKHSILVITLLSLQVTFGDNCMIRFVVGRGIGFPDDCGPPTKHTRHNVVFHLSIYRND